MNQERPLRIGILGAASIARRNWPAIQQSGNCQVVAIASRDLNRAKAMREQCQASYPFPEPPRLTDHYQSVLEDSAVDAVYIPLPTALRKRWVIRAAEAGKHVLCEKPCAVSLEDLNEMVEACQHHKVQFMDGVMFMHNPRLERLRDVLDDPQSIGPVRRITSVFSFLGEGDFGTNNIRAQTPLEPLGCLGDLGWYCIRFSLWVMRWQLPRSVTGRILAGPNTDFGDHAAVDFSGELDFEGSASAAFHCSFLATNQQWANVSGEKGWVRIPDFVLPRSDTQVAWEVNYQPVPKTATGIELGTATSANSQETLMFRNFANQIQSGSLNEEWPRISRLTQQVTDACWVSAFADGSSVTVG